MLSQITLVVKNPDNAGDTGLIPGPGISPEAGFGHPLQDSFFSFNLKILCFFFNLF